MQNNSKYSWVVIVLLILICLVYFFNKTGRDNSPAEVFTNPEGYEAGTTLSMYEGLPPTFPKELMLEKSKISSSSTLALPGGKTQTHISYMSDKSVLQVFDLYKYSMISGGWKLVTDATNPKVATISASRETEKFIITIIAGEAGSSVTFQYEK